MQDGRIAAVGTRPRRAGGSARIVDGRGKWVTPGHHRRAFAPGRVSEPRRQRARGRQRDVDPVTPNVWAEHALWPQDPGFAAALAGGVTAMQVLPGSGNLIGGRGVDHQERAGGDLPGDEIPGRALGPEDGLRRESQARLRRQGRLADDAHGQRRRLSRRLPRGAGLHAHLGQVPARAEAEEAASERRRRRSAAGAAGRRGRGRRQGRETAADDRRRATSPRTR